MHIWSNADPVVMSRYGSGHKTKWRTSSRYYKFSLRSSFKCKQIFLKIAKMASDIYTLGFESNKS